MRKLALLVAMTWIGAIGCGGPSETAPVFDDNVSPEQEAEMNATIEEATEEAGAAVEEAGKAAQEGTKALPKVTPPGR